MGNARSQTNKPTTLMTDEAGRLLVSADASASAVSSSTTSNASVSASITPVQLLAPNVARRSKPSIYYDGTAVLYVLVGVGVPSATNYTLKMGAGLVVFFAPEPDSYLGEIRGVWSTLSGAGPALVTEYLA